MYCAKCGWANRDGTTFCDACGALVGEATPAAPQPAVSTPAQSAVTTGAPPQHHLLPPPQPLAPAPKQNPWLVPTAVALAVVVVAGVLGFIWVSDRPGQQALTGSRTASGTAVPGGETGNVSRPTPREYVTAYYQAILDKQWQKAFDMQPAANKTGQTVAAFQQTQEQMYGMTAFSIFSDVTGSREATVVARQDLGANSIWNTTWTFGLEAGTWVAQTRKVALGEPGASGGGELPPGHPSITAP